MVPLSFIATICKLWNGQQIKRQGKGALLKRTYGEDLVKNNSKAPAALKQKRSLGVKFFLNFIHKIYAVIQSRSLYALK